MRQLSNHQRLLYSSIVLLFFIFAAASGSADARRRGRLQPERGDGTESPKGGGAAERRVELGRSMGVETRRWETARMSRGEGRHRDEPEWERRRHREGRDWEGERREASFRRGSEDRERANSRADRRQGVEERVARRENVARRRNAETRRAARESSSVRMSAERRVVEREAPLPAGRELRAVSERRLVDRKAIASRQSGREVASRRLLERSDAPSSRRDARDDATNMKRTTSERRVDTAVRMAASATARRRVVQDSFRRFNPEQRLADGERRSSSKLRSDSRILLRERDSTQNSIRLIASERAQDRDYREEGRYRAVHDQIRINFVPSEAKQEQFSRFVDPTVLFSAAKAVLITVLIAQIVASTPKSKCNFKTFANLMVQAKEKLF